MREILFRGKRTDNGEWVVSDTFYQCDGKVKIWDEPNRDGYVQVEKDTVGQYTGLTDKNGKKIFEGDYWIDTDDDYLVLVVEFRDGQFCFVSYGWNGALMPYGYDETAGGFGECDCEPMTNYYVERIEVIGNIHDNPDLLKGETK